jgi:hypothetical protein
MQVAEQVADRGIGPTWKIFQTGCSLPAHGRGPAREFQRGDTVTFNDRDGRSIGVIVRINQRTATLGTGDGGTWRVPFHALRHVLDV